MVDTFGTAYSQESLFKRIKKRHGHYVDRRQRYDEQRDIIVELTRPDLVAGLTGYKDEGEFESAEIVEGTAPYVAQVWQRGFMAQMISRRFPWFKCEMEEPDRNLGVTFKGNDEVNQYCQDIADQITSEYAKSTFYDVMPQFTIGGGTVGSPVMLYQHDMARDRIVCEVPDYAATWLDKDIFGRDNCLHVLRDWTALQAAEAFGIDQLPPSVKEQLRNGNHYTLTQYLQCIYGAGDVIYRELPGGEQVAQSHPWLEHWICLSSDQERDQQILRPLNRGPGYFSRPFSTWHYHRNSHEVYSRTMAWWAVYDIRGLNAMWEALFGEAESAIRPPVWALASLRGELDLGPGGGNYARNAQEYQTPPVYLERRTRYDVAMDFTQKVQASVERWFHYPYFMAVNQAVAAKTQPESVFALMRIESEQHGQLAPEVETYENQVLADSFDIFVDMERLAEPAYPWGRLPQPPQIVLDYSDGQVNPKFIGMLSMAQVRDREQLNFFRNIGMAEAVFQIQPETTNKIRWSEALEGVLEAGNFPQSWIVPEDQYQAVIDAMRQRAQQEALAAQAPQMTQAVKNLQGQTADRSPLALLTGATK